MRAEPTLSLTEEPDRDELHYLDDRLYEFNVAKTGIRDGRWLALFARDERGTIVGGLYGWTWGDACEIRTLWIEEAFRGRGLGSKLLGRAEEEAKARGARQIVLSTHSFQAPEFYKRFGFEIIGGVSDYPRGHRQFWLRKPLGG
jgi:ribosomal protein S18 acetylase RimI-like enzyme